MPQDLLLRDAKLRGELGAPDVRYLLVLHAADADGVLAKPFEVNDLLRIVSHYLGHPAPAVVHRDP